MFTQNALITETGRLQKFALRLTRNNSDADDLVQSTCLRALEKADSFEEGTNLFSWTSKIMYNLFVSNYRRRSKFESRTDPDMILENHAVAPSQYNLMELSNVKRAMGHLSADHRDVLTLVCIQGMRYEEVGDMMGIPVGTVRSRLSRAREHLQVLMDMPPSVAQEQNRMRA